MVAGAGARALANSAARREPRSARCIRGCISRTPSPLTEYDCWVTLMLIPDILRNLHQGRRQRLEESHEIAQVLREKGDGNGLLGESLKGKWNKKDAFP